MLQATIWRVRTKFGNLSPFYTGPPTGSGFESGLRPRNAGGPSNPDRDLDRLRLHGAESGNGSRKVLSELKWGFNGNLRNPLDPPLGEGLSPPNNLISMHIAIL